MRAFTFCATLFGKGAYSSAVVMVWPLSTIQFRKSTNALCLPASVHSAGTSNQVKLLIGYASLPGALVMETRKSSGMSFTEAAAAVTDSRLAFTKEPVAFCTLPYGILLERA